MIDATDKKILIMLQRDGHLTNAEIAEEVGLSVSAAHRRVKQLEASGIITGYGARVDRAAAGLSLLAFVFIKLDSHAEDHLAAFEKQVNLMDEVVSCSAVSGGGDYILQVVAPDMESFAEVALKKLVRLPGVKDSASQFVLSTMKETTGWPLSV